MTEPPDVSPVHVRGAATFEVAAVESGHRGPGPALAGAITVLVILLVVGGGLASSALFPSPEPSLSASPGLTPIPTTAVLAAETDVPRFFPRPQLSPSWTPRTLPKPTSVTAFVAGMRDGSLDGKLVFVSGRIHGRLRACPPEGAAPGCALLTMDGLHLSVVVDGARGAWQGDPAPGTDVVLRVAERTLFYVGSVLLVADGVPGTEYLTAGLPWPGVQLTPPTSLVEADGMLLRNDDTICFGSVTSCGRPAPYIVPVWQDAHGSIRYGEPIGVALAPVVVGMDVANSWTTGPFLVRDAAPRECPASYNCPLGPVWEVVTREAPGGIVSVRLP